MLLFICNKEAIIDVSIWNWKSYVPFSSEFQADLTIQLLRYMPARKMMMNFSWIHQLHPSQIPTQSNPIQSKKQKQNKNYFLNFFEEIFFENINKKFIDSDRAIASPIAVPIQLRVVLKLKLI